MKINFGNVAKNYAKYRNDLPSELLDSLRLRGIVFHDKKVADLGSGSGVLCRVLQQEGAAVVGVEPSVELIEEAKAIDGIEGYSIEYVNSFSEDTSLKEDAYDYVTVLRAWHWFNADKTLSEIKRILKKDGSLIVMDSGFLSNSKIVKDTLELIKNHMPNGELKSPGSKAKTRQVINSFPVDWFQTWRDHQFDLQDTYKFHYNVTFSNEAWCGRVGSLSWLSGFSESKREKILAELLHYLEKEYKDVTHNVEHGCYVAILNRL